MPSIGKVCVLGAAAVALSACAGLELGTATGVSPRGSPFDQALYTEYMSLSQIEYDEADYKDSDVFALRAIAAGSGMSPAPEAINARPLPAANVGELTAARARLVSALAKGASDKAPQPTAHAQVMYECWMQEQELAENFQPDDIAFCRNGFADAMAKAEAAVMTAQVTPPPAAMPTPAAMPAATPPTPVAAPVPGPFMVYFEFDSATLAPAARKVVVDAAKAVAAATSSNIFVAGYTDRSGADAYNMALSMRRAEAVADELAMAGVKAEVKISGHGEDQSHVSTPDGQREAMNRVVSIYLQQ